MAQMMNAYYYTPDQVGLKEFPPGYMRLQGFALELDPTHADCFVLPCDIRHVTNEQIHALPYLVTAERRHVFYCNSDQPHRTLGLPAIIFRADCNLGIMRLEPSSIAWPWPVKDLKEFAYPPAQGFEYDVTFVGWNSTPLTQQVCNSILRQADLKSYIQLNNEFYGTWETNNDTEKLTYYRALFLEKMHVSRLSLCARSIAAGVMRYRFYEAMSMARVPVLFCDSCVLPFADRIDYNNCSIQIPERHANDAGRFLKEWLTRNSDETILKMGAYGRQMWERWLAGSQWEKVWGEIVNERLVDLYRRAAYA